MFLRVQDTSENYHAIATHTELIKIITGCSKQRAKAVAKLLTLRCINEIPAVDLNEAGITQAQQKKLKAAADFGKLDYLNIARIDTEIIDDPRVAAKHCQDLIGSSHVENGAILVLDIKHRIIHKEVFSIGTEDACLFHPRQVFEIILRHRGTRFIVAHNHPSGKSEPSPEDLLLTEQLAKASKSIEIPILDHLVVTAESYTSIRHVSTIWERNGLADH